MLLQLLGIFAEFDRDTKTLVVDDEQAAVVEAIFAKYVTERLGATLIAGWLNETGRRTNYGNLWTAKGVPALLRNPCLRRQDPPRRRHPRRQAQTNHRTGKRSSPFSTSSMSAPATSSQRRRTRTTCSAG